MTNNNCTVDRPYGDSHESIDYNHNTKTIYFVRHGVALHNVPDPSTGDYHNKYDPRLTDPPLISDGEEQIRNVGRKLRGVGLDLVVTSPLTRCLQTTQLIIHEWISSNSVSSPHVVCLENVREAFGKHYPDKRSPKSLLQNTWPSVNFDPEMSEQDRLWKADTRETINDVQKRVDSILQWISERNESSFLVTSHGIWIECCLLKYRPSILEMGRKRVYNCDIYQIKMITKRSASRPSSFTITSASQL